MLDLSRQDLTLAFDSREGVNLEVKSPSDDSRRLVVKLVLVPFIKGRLSLSLSSSSPSWDPRSYYAVRVDGDDPLPAYACFDPKPKLNSTISSKISSAITDKISTISTLPTVLTANIDVAKISRPILVRLIELNRSPLSSELNLDAAAGFLDISSMFMDSVKNCFDASSSSEGHARVQSRMTFVSIKDRSLTMDVNVEACFLCDGVSPTAHLAFSRAVGDTPMSLEAKNRIELGLKQAFVMADTDNSGCVSFEEAGSLRNGFKSSYFF